jgi:hypothetical protein
MYPELALGGGNTDGDIFDRPSETCHRMAFEMGKNDIIIIVIEMAADKSRSSEGIGLGLSFAEMIVRLHHGTITEPSRRAAFKAWRRALLWNCRWSISGRNMMKH